MARGPKRVDTYAHEGTRKNNPTAEFQSLNEQLEEASPVDPQYYPRHERLDEGETRDRDPDLDPQLVWKGMTITITEEQRKQLQETGTIELGEAQLVWRGKDTQDWSDLVVNVPPIYVQEKVHPRVIIDDLKKMSAKAKAGSEATLDLFADFNGIDPDAYTEFYQHEVHWSNRMILGDSMQVMASLAEREALRGKVQCIYFDPPYGIKFNSNWQVSTRNRDVKDGKLESLTREPEQVKAFRDTWKDGIHSYLTYLRDRLTVARDLLTESGSIFVQIGDENVHRVRALMDEVFGEENFCGLITYKKTTGAGSPAIGTTVIAGVKDYVVWYAKAKTVVKYRQLYRDKEPGSDGAASYNRVQSPDGMIVRGLRIHEDFNIDYEPKGWKLVASDNLTSQTGVASTQISFNHFGELYRPSKGGWKTNELGLSRLSRASRLTKGGIALRYVRGLLDFPAIPINDDWQDTSTGSFTEEKVYVVQSGTKAVARCILMTTDPGDIVLDPTCGSGTTAYVAEQWGRKWVTIDTSRVALALARTRLMSARYPYYVMRDTPEGREAEMKLTGQLLPDAPTHGELSQGFVYERAPHITLKSIANNAEIDVIWESYEEKLALVRTALTKALPGGWLKAYRAEQNYDVDVPDDIQEWEIPRDLPGGWPADLHGEFWELRIARQREIDTSIAQKADVEMLYDRPVEDNSKVRVSGPFTVESLSPHRVVPMDDQDDALQDAFDDLDAKARRSSIAPEEDFANVILDNLKSHGVQQGSKEDRINFTHISAWPGDLIAAEAHFAEGENQRRAAILIGPEYGAIHRTDLAAAAREASEARFDILIACGFAFDAHATGFDRLGPVTIIKAKMNPDLHMAEELKNTGKGNLFMVIGEPDIDIEELPDGKLKVKLNGMDVFVPATGEIRSGEKDDIAAWFIDTAYNEESFFVRHAYFPGKKHGDKDAPYKALSTSLEEEINKEAWQSLYRDVSRPFERPVTGRFAVKVINHFGDEVMKVFTV